MFIGRQAVTVFFDDENREILFEFLSLKIIIKNYSYSDSH